MLFGGEEMPSAWVEVINIGDAGAEQNAAVSKADPDHNEALHAYTITPIIPPAATRHYPPNRSHT